MAKRYVCKACNKGCQQGKTHVCDQMCSDCMSSPPCIPSGVRFPCDECNRHFRSQTCFDNHKTKQSGGRQKKSVCELKKNCGSCGLYVTRKDHVCNTRCCHTCKQYKEVGHLCFMKQLQNKPAPTDKVPYVFYDFETTQDTKYSETATVHVLNLVCVQQFCSKCESNDDIDEDCSECGRRKHSFGTTQ
jgi:hypothetical protein